MRAVDPFYALTHDDIDEFVLPLTMGAIPSKLPTVGIALAFIFLPDEETGNIFISRFCKDIYENEEDILSFLRGARTEKWAKIAETDTKLHFTRIDSIIGNFADFKDGARVLCETFSRYQPLQALVDPLDMGKQIPIRSFSKRILYAAGAYSRDFVNDLDAQYAELFGYMFPSGNYGPIGGARQAHRLIRDIISDIVLEFEKGTPIQVIRYIVQERAFPLIPHYIEPSDETEQIDLDDVIRVLVEANSPIETLKAIRDHPILVSDLIFFTLPDVIKVQRDAGLEENAEVLKHRFGYIKNLRAALLETTPDFGHVSQRLGELVDNIDNMTKATEAGESGASFEKYMETLQTFLEFEAFVAANDGNYDFQGKSIDVPRKARSLLSKAEGILEKRAFQRQDRGYSKWMKLYEAALTKIDPSQQPFQWTYISNMYASNLLQDRTANRGNSIERVVELLEKALEIMPTLDQLTIATFEQGELLWGVTHGHLGNAFADRLKGDRQANLQRAFHHFERALMFQHEIKHTTAWALTQQNLGSVCAESQPLDWEEQVEFLVRAVTCFRNALRVTDQNNLDAWTHLKMNLSMAMQELRAIGLDSNEIHQRVIEEENRERIPLDDLTSILGQYRDKYDAGMIEETPKEPARSPDNDRHLDFTEDILSSVPSPSSMPLRDQAALYRAQGLNLVRSREGSHLENVLRAIEYFQQALEIYDKQIFAVDWAHTHYNIGTAYLDLASSSQGYSLGHLWADNWGISRPFDGGYVPNIMEHYYCALEILSPEREPVLVRQMGQAMGSVNLRLQNWSQAVEGYRIAIQADSILFQNALTEKSRDRELVMLRDVDLDEAGHLYPNMAFALTKTGEHEEAWKILEKGKARRIREALGYQDVEFLKANDRDELSSLNAEIVRLQKEIAGTSGQSHFERTVDIKRLEELINKRQSLISKVQAYAPNFMRDGHSYQDIVTVLPRKAAIVELLITTEGTVAFILCKASNGEACKLDVVNIERLNTRKLRSIMRRDEKTIYPGSWLGCLLGRSGNPNYAFPEDGMRAFADYGLFSGAAAAVGELFWDRIDPALQERNVDKVLFVLQDDLALFPVHAGVMSKDESSVTGALERYQCCYAPSAQAWHKARTKPLTEFDDMAILISPVNVNDFDFLHLEAWIVRYLMSAVSRSVRILDTTAMREDEIIETIQHCNVLHYAGHAEYNWGDPSKSGLKLWRKGKQILRLEDIWSPNFFTNMNLVLLSGCTTTMFDFRSGKSDEYIGLPSAFIGSGAKAVIGSLWRVDDLAAFVFSMCFYRTWIGENTLGTVSIANAVNKTQQWMKEATVDEYIAILRKYQEQCRVNKEGGDRFSENAEPEFAKVIKELQKRGKMPFSVFDWATFQVVGDAL